MPNQTSMIVASERTMRSPIASTLGDMVAVRLSHCCVMKLSNEFPIIAPFCQKRCIGNSEQLLNGLVTERLSDSSCVGGDVAVVVGLVPVSRLQRQFQRVLLLLLLHDLLQALRLCHLARLLLRAELNQERLIDALQRSKFGLLGWIAGVACCFERHDVGRALRRIRPDRSERLKARDLYRIAQIK